MNHPEFKAKNHFPLLLIYPLYYNILMVELHMVISWLINSSCGRTVDHKWSYMYNSDINSVLNKQSYIPCARCYRETNYKHINGLHARRYRLDSPVLASLHETSLPKYKLITQYGVLSYTGPEEMTYTHVRRY